MRKRKRRKTYIYLLKCVVILHPTATHVPRDKITDDTLLAFFANLFLTSSTYHLQTAVYALMTSERNVRKSTPGR